MDANKAGQLNDKLLRYVAIVICLVTEYNSIFIKQHKCDGERHGL